MNRSEAGRWKSRGLYKRSETQEKAEGLGEDRGGLGWEQLRTRMVEI